ncbi:MAG: T9SS type A sorting domain-containing protein [Bacteroidota bacterium]
MDVNLLSRLIIALSCVSSYYLSKAQISYPFQDLNFNTSGNVNTVAVDKTNNVTYIGGIFKRVNTSARGTELDPVTAINSKDYPQPNGPVFVSISDESGGYYIGGSFTKVGNFDRPYLAHINSNGQVTSWNPSPDNVVRALALSGDIIYVGGFFQNVGGLSRQYLAAVDVNGNITPWAPTADSPNIDVIATDGSTIYVGGSFNSINNTFQNRLSALDINGDLIPTWNANVGGGGFTVMDIAIKDGIIYLAGSFTVVNSEGRNRLAAVDQTGTLTNWNPSASGIVRSIDFEGDIAYIGGDFTSITTSTGTFSRKHLAAVDLSGEVTSWDPNVFFTTTQNAVLALSTSNGIIYVGGNFTAVQGQSRIRAAAINTSGVIQDWNPLASSTVRAITATNDGVYVGGSFTSIGGVPRNGLAAFDANGNVTDWNPFPNSSVRTIEVGNGTVYVGGDFTEIAGEPRDRLAAFDVNGTLTSWNPSVFGSVRDILVSGDTVYIAGSFPRISGELRSRLAAVHVDGTLTDWDPSVSGGGNIVTTLTLADDIIYTGGDFTTIGGVNRNGIAAINVTTGSVTGWDPSAAAGSVFNGIGVSQGIVYVGGEFSTVGGSSVTNLAAIDASTANTTSWAPEVDGIINALIIGAGNIYVGGNFTTIDIEPRAGMAAIDRSGSVLSWNVNLTHITTAAFVNSLATNQEAIFIGGLFTDVNNDPEKNLASIYLFDETNPVFTSASAIAVPENTVGTAYTARADESVTFSLGTSKDEALFVLATNELSFITAPDFENPSDGDSDNQYLLDITATDVAGNATTQQLSITVTNEDEEVILGLEDRLNFSIYPNPTSNQLAIRGIELSNYDRLTITTIEGKQVLDFEDLSVPQFDISTLSSGIYMLMLQSNDGIINRSRIIKR